MRYPDKMDRPLSDDDRRWLRGNNMGTIADRFDAEDGLLDESEEEAEEVKPRNYSGMTVKQLVAEINDRNEEIRNDDPEAELISTEGKKRDLIDRLKQDDDSIVEEDK